jgi:hypothetical protein
MWIDQKWLRLVAARTPSRVSTNGQPWLLF